jgi:protein involved in polysaccharide export with SLBB domain
VLFALLGAWAIAIPTPIPAADADGKSVPKTNAVQLERVIVVQGEVQRPGRFSWTEGVTLTNAVELAGGFTPFANTERVIIRRGNGSKERHSYARIIQGRAKNPMLKPNDSVEVRCF